MAYLLDTGIILRLVDRADSQHATVRAAVRQLGARRDQLYISTQNVSEFCNVCTRPVENNGLGLPPADAVSLLELEIEPFCDALPDAVSMYAHLKRLIATYNVIGKQVHDARLVAMMLAWQIESILTLNDRDFRRFEPEGINVVTPADLAAAP